MSWLLLPLASFAAMFAQDVLCVVMVRAEASGNGHRAGACDVAQDWCAIVQLGTVGDALFVSHDLPLSVAIIAARLAADYLGTRTGVWLGKRLDERGSRADPALAE
jgi:hypothetical protein